MCLSGTRYALKVLYMSCDTICFTFGQARKERMFNMKKAYGEPLAAAMAVVTLISLRFAIKRMVKRYSGVKL